MTPADKTDMPQWMTHPALLDNLCRHLCEQAGDDPDETVYDCGPNPGIWGELRMKYEDEAKGIIAIIARHAPKDSWQPISTAVDDLNQRNQLKADLFDYLVWLQDRCPFRDAALEGKLGDYLVCASDGTTCWGKTYQEALMVARKHDMGLQDAAAPADKQEGAGTL